jgi:hypothetical protein
MAEFFSHSKEKFLILDVAPQSASALFLDFDEHRELILKKVIENLDLKKFLAAQAGSIFQKSWEGNYFFNSRRQLVVLADASLATTIPIPLDFKRDAETADSPVTQGEVEDWFARATAKIFAGCRLEASRRLRTSDVDTVLVNQRVDRIAIDGRATVDPIGHSGKKISFVIELTFANRELSELLMPFFNAPGEFFFAEAPQARLAALARIRSLPINIITVRDRSRSSLFVFQEAEQGCPVVYREPFLWDGFAIIRSIAEDLGISEGLAEEIYDAYIHGALSDAAKKHFDAFAVFPVKQFLQAIDKASLRGPVYVDAPRDLPVALPYRRRHAAIEDIPIEALLKKFGFSAGDGTSISSRVALRYLAPFFELYFDNNRSELNELLRKKLHWLA